MAPEEGSTGTSILCNNNNFKTVELNQLESGQERLENECTKDGSVDRHGKPALKGRTVNQGLATLAFAGIEVNLVQFSKSVLRQSNAEAALMFSIWMGTVYLFSLMGAFLSNSYLGRYVTCVIFQVLCIIGLIGLSLSTNLFLIKPYGCGKIGEVCEPHKPLERAMFYASIYLVALGNGASEPALAAFGADQFDEEDPKERRSKALFYSYFYVALNLGNLVAETGTSRYRHFKPSGNPLSRFSQVIVASMRKLNQNLPSNEEELHEIRGKEGETNGMKRILHTKGFKILDRAAIIMPEDTRLIRNKGQTPSPWHLCTVTQFEEVKCVLRLLPVWLCIIFSSLVFIQMLSLFVEQGAAMSRTVSNFHIPPASMAVFDIVSTSVFIIPQFVLVGVSEAFVYVAQMEFFASQTPDGLKSLGMGLSMSSSAMGIYVETAILTVVMKITSKNGKPGWVPPNLNDGHLDRFFFVSAALAALNFALYVLSAKRYKSISLGKRDGANENEVTIGV
ncbi:hypothetical protein TIFTF001_044645 [Ficus carica]|uniref:Uncharacterized protein n=1 Tax=Ficus carica TaxID=3494 RepID=A0AA87ZG25_FICCA|nr:hypothetical protein TIFTF001_044645 [Ficus carica]